jgi:RND superfamily putative drug exporter
VPYRADSTQAHAALTQLRSVVIPQAVPAGAAAAGVDAAGVEVVVGGGIAYGVDYVDQLRSRAPLVIGFVLLMTFLLMTFSFSSVVVGLVTIAANLLSAGAAFGVLVLVFQSRWGADLLGFTFTGGVIAWIPVFLFVILFGLSMDYHVLVISRIKENVDRGLPVRDAVREGSPGPRG